MQAQPLEGGSFVASGRLWVAPEAETDPRAVAMQGRGSDLPLDALARRYLPPVNPLLIRIREALVTGACPLWSWRKHPASTPAACRPVAEERASPALPAWLCRLHSAASSSKCMTSAPTVQDTGWPTAGAVNFALTQPARAGLHGQHVQSMHGVQLQDVTWAWPRVKQACWQRWHCRCVLVRLPRGTADSCQHRV